MVELKLNTYRADKAYFNTEIPNLDIGDIVESHNDQFVITQKDIDNTYQGISMSSAKHYVFKISKIYFKNRRKHKFATYVNTIRRFEHD